MGNGAKFDKIMMSPSDKRRNESLNIPKGTRVISRFSYLSK